MQKNFEHFSQRLNTRNDPTKRYQLLAGKHFKLARKSNNKPTETKKRTMSSNLLLNQKTGANEFDFWLKERLTDNDLALLQQNLADFTKGDTKSTVKAKPLVKPIDKTSETGEKRSKSKAGVKVYGGTAKLSSTNSYCVFPFVYDAEVYENCIPSKDRKRNWCALSSNYDRDALWGFCEETNDDKIPSKRTHFSNETSRNSDNSGKEMKELLGSVLENEGVSHKEKRKILRGLTDKTKDVSFDPTSSWQSSSTTAGDPLFYELSDTLEEEEEKLLSQKSDWKPGQTSVNAEKIQQSLNKDEKMQNEFTDSHIKEIFEKKNKEDVKKVAEEKDGMHSEHIINRLLTATNLNSNQSSTIGTLQEKDEFETISSSPTKAIAEKITVMSGNTDSKDSLAERFAAEKAVTQNEDSKRLEKQSPTGVIPMMQSPTNALVINKTEEKSFDIMEGDAELQERVKNGEEEETVLLSEESRLKHQGLLKEDQQGLQLRKPQGETTFLKQNTAPKNTTKISFVDLNGKTLATAASGSNDAANSSSIKYQNSFALKPELKHQENEAQPVESEIQQNKPTKAQKTSALLNEYFKKYENYPLHGRAISNNPHDSNKQIETENGEFCVFPFVHKGKTYFDCTKDDDPKGQYWCSTSDTHNYDRNPKKGMCKSHRRGDILVMRKTRTTIKSGQATVAGEQEEKHRIEVMKTALSNTPHVPKKIVQTDKGKACVFPFVYKGESYFDCTSEDDRDGKLWCSMTKNYDQDPRKGYCIIGSRDTSSKSTSDKRVTDDEDEIALRIQQERLKDSPTTPTIQNMDANQPTLDATNDEDLNNVIVNEAMAQRLKEQQVKTKLNPLSPNRPEDFHDPSLLKNPLSTKPNLNGLSVLNKNTYTQLLKPELMDKYQSLTQEQKEAMTNGLIQPTSNSLAALNFHQRLKALKNPQTMGAVGGSPVPKLVMTENGDACIFLFKYKQQIFTECTNVDDISGKNKILYFNPIRMKVDENKSGLRSPKKSRLNRVKMI